MEKSTKKLQHRYLENMKSNSKKRERKEKSNLPFTGMYLFVKLIEEQNKILLSKIAKDKFRFKDERINFINEYLKLNYQVPEITEDKEYELNQDIIE
tara:strand:+ start:260 stop:550 length:291 start_codon:yes stop_codon:yes gene_type:complete